MVGQIEKRKKRWMVWKDKNMRDKIDGWLDG